MNWRKKKRICNILRKQFGFRTVRADWSLNEDCMIFEIERQGLEAYVLSRTIDLRLTGLDIRKARSAKNMAYLLAYHRT